MELADNVPEIADPKESSSGSKALVSLLGGRDVDLKRVSDLLKVKLDSVNTLDKEKKRLVGGFWTRDNFRQSWSPVV